EEDFSLAGYLDLQCRFERGHGAVEIARDEAGDIRLAAAGRDQLEPAGAPALMFDELLPQPIGESADAADADLLALHAGDGGNAALRARLQHHVRRLGREDADAFFRRALGDEADIGAGAERHVEA